MFLRRFNPTSLPSSKRHLTDAVGRRINFADIDARYGRSQGCTKKPVANVLHRKAKGLIHKEAHVAPEVVKSDWRPSSTRADSMHRLQESHGDRRAGCVRHGEGFANRREFGRARERGKSRQFDEEDGKNAQRHKTPRSTPNYAQNLHDATFASFKLLPELQAVLNANGLTVPTKVQSLLLTKYFTTRKDLLFAAKTGTGKSLGYLLTLLNERVIPVEGSHFEPRNLIIVPNGTLALQIHRWALTLKCTSTKLLIPGVDAEQVDAAYSKPSPSHILIGTPERLRIALANGSLKTANLSTIVLDEADYLIKPLKLHATLAQHKNRIIHPVPALVLMRELLNVCKVRPRLLLTSATLNRLTRKDLERERIVNKDALFFKDTAEEVTTCPAAIKHFHRLVDARSPEELLFALQDIHARHKGHAGIAFLPQNKSKQNFRNWLESHKLDFSCAYLQDNANPNPDTILIGSDNDARGIDLPDVRYVIILDPPETPTSYLHMAGRVGRVGQGSKEELHAVYTILGQPSDLEIHTTRLSLIKLASVPF